MDELEDIALEAADMVTGWHGPCLTEDDAAERAAQLVRDAYALGMETARQLVIQHNATLGR